MSSQESLLKKQEKKFLAPSEVVSAMGGKSGMIRLCRERIKNLVFDVYAVPVAKKVIEMRDSPESESQGEIAELLGMSEAELSHFEVRVKNMAAEKVLELSARLGVPIRAVETEQIEDAASRQLLTEACRIRRKAGEDAFDDVTICRMDLHAFLELIWELPFVNPDEVLLHDEDALLEKLECAKAAECERIAATLHANPIVVLRLAADMAAVMQYMRPVVPALALMVVGVSARSLFAKSTDLGQVDDAADEKPARELGLAQFGCARRYIAKAHTEKNLVKADKLKVIAREMLLKAKPFEMENREWWVTLATLEDDMEMDGQIVKQFCIGGLAKWPDEVRLEKLGRRSYLRSALASPGTIIIHGVERISCKRTFELERLVSPAAAAAANEERLKVLRRELFPK